LIQFILKIFKHSSKKQFSIHVYTVSSQKVRIFKYTDIDIKFLQKIKTENHFICSFTGIKINSFM